MNANILNRDFAHPDDGKYMFEPYGRHPNAEAKAIQIIDEKSANSQVKNFNADAAAGKLSHGNEIVIDFDHRKHQMDQESRAAGWLHSVFAGIDGIYGEIRWTSSGRAAVDGGDYRFFSTEYDLNDAEILNGAKGSREIRPLKLSGLTLTNMPNNKGGKPITNRVLSPEETAAAIRAENQSWAKSEFEKEAQRISDLYKMDGETAREIALFLNRDVGALAGIPATGSLKDADRGLICNRFASLVERYKKAHATSYRDAWATVARLEADFFKATFTERE